MRTRVVLDCAAMPDGVSCCRQSETANTDLHAAVKRYRKTGVCTGALTPCDGARFGDFSTAPADYLSAQVLLRNADSAFAGLSARVRDRFQNDPVQLLTFLADAANFNEAVSLGLAVPRPQDEAGTQQASEDAAKPTA